MSMGEGGLTTLVWAGIKSGTREFFRPWLYVLKWLTGKR